MRVSIVANAGLLLFVFSIVGCQESEIPSSSADATTSTTSDENRSKPENSDLTPVDGTAESESAATKEEQETTTTISEVEKQKQPRETFQPPFPHRVDFFAPPVRQQGVASKTNEHDEMVELQGFANVGEMKVVLAVDGVITPIALGGKKFGIQVIAIEPPKVVLQRGRERWTATLEN